MLLKQLLEKGLKPAIFSIFNYIEDNGYLVEWENVSQEKFSIDDLEYIYFQLPENIKNGLKYRNKEITKTFNEFKFLIENKIQFDKNKPKTMVLINKDNGECFLINQKSFDLISELKNFAR